MEVYISKEPTQASRISRPCPIVSDNLLALRDIEGNSKQVAVTAFPEMLQHHFGEKSPHRYLPCKYFLMGIFLVMRDLNLRVWAGGILADALWFLYSF